MTFISHLSQLFDNNKNVEDAIHMKNYMKGKFEFFGIKAQERRELLKSIYKQHEDELKGNPKTVIKQLYNLPQREFHMCAIELAYKHLNKKWNKEDIDFIEYLLTTNSWWDSVDYIAKQLLGGYLLIYPSEIKKVITSFSNNNNLWLNRSSIIYQLGYKSKTDEAILFSQCLKFKKSDEFFIQKAIGWALREYAKVNPDSVLNFVNSAGLKILSHKEAIRNINK